MLASPCSTRFAWTWRFLTPAISDARPVHKKLGTPDHRQYLLSAVGISYAYNCGSIWVGPRLRDAYNQWFPPPAFVSGDCSSLYAEMAKPVVIFTTSTCPYCKKVRKLLEINHVDFADLVVNESGAAEQRFREVGGKAVPALFIGKRMIVGFREDAITEALKLIPNLAFGHRQERPNGEGKHDISLNVVFLG